jgi:pimeloyl-ACP methyl ester carboxylesterase
LTTTPRDANATVNGVKIHYLTDGEAFEWFRAFERDASDFAALAKTKLPMPVLVLAGAKASGAFLIDQGRTVAINVEGAVVEGAGHWLMEEAPQQTIPRLLAFLGSTS